MKLPEWAKWMARDKDGVLNAYENKPYKSVLMEEWLSDDARSIISGVSTHLDNVEWSDEEPTEIANITLKEKGFEFDPIEPEHYNKGEIDLYESWYLTRPFNEFRAILESIAERYMKRDKANRLEDIDKCIYTLQRLREYEALHAKEVSK